LFIELLHDVFHDDFQPKTPCFSTDHPFQQRVSRSNAALAKRKGAERQNLISIKSNVRAERAAHGSCSFLQLALFIFPRFPSLS
jgi:hypothetical protein